VIEDENGAELARRDIQQNENGIDMENRVEVGREWVPEIVKRLTQETHTLHDSDSE